MKNTIVYFLGLIVLLTVIGNLDACQPKTRQAKIEAFCHHLQGCFTKASYGACVVGAQTSDQGTEQEMVDVVKMTHSTCDELEVLGARLGVNYSALKGN